MKWTNRDRKLKKRRKIKLQDRVHRERGQGKDKQSQKRMAKILKAQRRMQELWEIEDYE